MPSLIRFLFILCLLGAIGYGGVYALATFVEPNPREITVRIPPEPDQSLKWRRAGTVRRPAERARWWRPFLK